jgi:hypothetical protein
MLATETPTSVIDCGDNLDKPQAPPKIRGPLYVDNGVCEY